MNRTLIFGFAALLAASGSSTDAGAGSTDSFRYRGPCDASAAVALDADHFVVGNDEDSVLRIYRRGQAQEVARLDLTTFLGVAPDDEVDIEAAALLGQRIYWISSHGRDSRGKKAPERRRFFATDIVDGAAGQPPQLRAVGQPYTGLLDALETAKVLKHYKLARAARRAPEDDDGLNIEGLAATPDGQLLIGLRNPLPQRRALLIPLTNPAAAIGGQEAQLGPAVELDLGGRGVRSIDRVGSSYLIVAGPPADDGTFALYRWSGRTAEAPQELSGVDFEDLRPEALFAIPGSPRVQVLSDDGGVKMAGGTKCKKLPASEQTFRSLILTP